MCQAYGLNPYRRLWRSFLLGVILHFLFPGCLFQCFALEPTTRIAEYAHTAWQPRENGLMSAPVAIEKTNDGYIWIGTNGGFYRFDRIRFTPRPTVTNTNLSDDYFEDLHAAKGRQSVSRIY